MSEGHELLVSCVVYDHYMTKVNHNSPPFLSAEKRASVIRVFGATSNGQKVCLHVHGVRHYFYVRPENRFAGSAFDDIGRDKLENFRRELEFAFKSRVEKEKGWDGNPREYHQAVHSMEVVKGKGDIYGYHQDPISFIKIIMNNPADKRLLVEIVRNPDFMCCGYVLQPYESHINYLMQFTSDYHIKPMDWIHLNLGQREVRFRSPLPPSVQGESYPALLTRNTVPEDLRWVPSPPKPAIELTDSQMEGVFSQGFLSKVGPRWKASNPEENSYAKKRHSLHYKMSTSELEFDVLASSILNRNKRAPPSTAPSPSPSLSCRFGQECWDLIQSLREAKNLPNDIPPKVENTNTAHVDGGQKALDYVARWAKLKDVNPTPGPATNELANPPEDQVLGQLPLPLLQDEHESSDSDSDSDSSDGGSDVEGGKCTCYQCRTGSKCPTERARLRALRSQVEIQMLTQHNASQHDVPDEEPDCDARPQQKQQNKPSPTQLQQPKETLKEQPKEQQQQQQHQHQQQHQQQQQQQQQRKKQKGVTMADAFKGRPTVSPGINCSDVYTNGWKKRKDGADEAGAERLVGSPMQVDDVDDGLRFLSPTPLSAVSAETPARDDACRSRGPAISALAVSCSQGLQQLRVQLGFQSESGTQTSPGPLLLAPAGDLVAPIVRLPPEATKSRSGRNGIRGLTFVDGKEPEMSTVLRTAHYSKPAHVPAKLSENPELAKRQESVRLLSLPDFDPGLGPPWRGTLSNLRLFNANSAILVIMPTGSRAMLCPTVAPPPPTSRLRPKVRSLAGGGSSAMAGAFPMAVDPTPLAGVHQGELNPYAIATPKTARSDISPSKTNAPKPQAQPPAPLAPIARNADQLAKSRLTVLSMELTCITRQKGDVEFAADPSLDRVAVLVYHVEDIVGNAESEVRHRHVGILCLDEVGGLPRPDVTDDAARETRARRLLATLQPMKRETASSSSSSGKSGVSVSTLSMNLYANEAELLLAFADKVKEVDPDIAIGYEVQFNSWGYFIARGRTVAANLGQDLKETRFEPLLHLEQACSRLPWERGSVDTTLLSPTEAHARAPQLDSQPERSQDDSESQPEHAAGGRHRGGAPPHHESIAAFTHREEKESGVMLKGRIVLNIWKRMKSELKLTCNTVQSVASLLFSTEEKPRTFPRYSSAQLSRWFRSPTEWRLCVSHVRSLATLNVELCDHPTVDLVRRTAEYARIVNIDFFSCCTRGSQYRVEAALLQQAHRQGYLLMSASPEQVRKQPVLLEIPHLFEPESNYYSDPVIVVDFQSLYPSIVCARNMCYSTLIAQLKMGRSGDEHCAGVIGCAPYPQELAAKVARSGIQPFISSSGAAFVSPEVRPGVLPAMLGGILETRFMLKRAIKEFRGDDDAVLRMVLDAQQLALKLLANVTYGYTTSSFSGRMPCSALADAIVSEGKATLQWAQKETESFDARLKVVYGDTDSLFIRATGCSREEAFALGRELVKLITKKLPRPMELKFEKVYHPCILQTKKRYVGYAWEREDQLKPIWDAKGIETVRRDGCGALRKLTEQALRTLFDSSDLSRVRSCVEDAWRNLLTAGPRGGVFIQDLVFAKEVRFGNYASDPPGALVVKRKMEVDKFQRIPYKWRVPYVVVCGARKAIIKELVVDPEEVLRRGSEMRINSSYYLERVINNPLARLLRLAGCDVLQWFKEMPKLKPATPRNITYHNPGHTASNTASSKGKSISNNQAIKHFIIGQCQVCYTDFKGNNFHNNFLCKSCFTRNSDNAILVEQRLRSLLNTKERDDFKAMRQCVQCSAKVAGPCNTPRHSSALFRKDLVGPDSCRNFDCAVLHHRVRVICDLQDLEDLLK